MHSLNPKQLAEFTGFLYISCCIMLACSSTTIDTIEVNFVDVSHSDRMKMIKSDETKKLKANGRASDQMQCVMIS